jgi:SAM-dependent methyltransferase
MKKATISNSLSTLYDGYYNENDKTLQKRELTALDTVNHIQSIYDISKAKKILDVGAGEGSLLSCLSKLEHDFQLFGVEISTSGVETIRSKHISKLVEIMQFDGYKIPYPDKYFDVAICIHVLEHVEHERLFINELKRVASAVIFEVPLEHTMKVNKAITISRPYGHINFYTVDTFINLLETSSINIRRFRVLTFSQEFERFIGGNVKGLIKHSIRSAFLHLLPWLAPSLMVYFCIALCDEHSEPDSIDC